MNMQDCERKIAALVAAVVAKGWDDTRANMPVEIDAKKGTSVLGVWIYAYHTLENLDVIDHKSVYIGQDTIKSLTVSELADKFQTVNEFNNGKLFEAINLVKEAAANAGIEEVFINPLTAIAEKLATNALEDKSNAKG